MGMQIDDFFTSGSLTFILMILALGSLPAAFILWQKIGLGLGHTAVVMISAFCAMAGFFAFTLSITVFAIGSGIFYLLIGVVVRSLRSTWGDAEEPDLEVARAEDHATDGRQGALRAGQALAAALGLGGHFLAFIMRIFNFVMQA